MKAKTNQQETKNQNNNPFFSSPRTNGFLSIQAKYTIGEPGDALETEADQVAERVTNSEPSPFFNPGNSSLVQRRPEITIQEKPSYGSGTAIPSSGKEKEKKLLPKSEHINRSPDEETDKKIGNSLGNGNPMDRSTRAFMENGFGANFSGVKIHRDSTAADLSNRLGANAFTTGNDIYFNSGKYNPQTLSGRNLLAHELTHTIQQGASSKVDGKPQIQRWPWDTATPEQTREAEKQAFTSRNYGPITYTQSAVSGSGFEASYLPAQSRLNVTVRGKVHFKDTLSASGGAYSSPNSFMNNAGFIPIMNALPPEVQSRILPYFQWTEDQKQIHMIRFRENLAAATAIWQDTGMSFQVAETGWEDITATPSIHLDITEGDAAHNTTASGTNESTSDHLQVEIVKQPSADDVANITRVITEYNAATGATVTSGMIRGVRSYLGNDPGSRSTAPQGFNNLMSIESDRMDDPNTKFYFTTVNFANNESQLSEGARAELDTFFADPAILMNNADRGVEIDLHGYASAPGSADYNRTLVESRINAVQSYIDGKIDNSSINSGVYTTSRENDSDTSAEEDLATNPALHDPADYRRVDVMITRQGRGGQNVFAHELGHVFGLGDEYAETANGYNRPAGSTASHDQLAKNAGVSAGAVVGNDSRMMSTGNVVGAAHYSTFADALRQLTSKSWRVNN